MSTPILLRKIIKEVERKRCRTLLQRANRLTLFVEELLATRVLAIEEEKKR